VFAEGGRDYFKYSWLEERVILFCVTVCDDGYYVQQRPTRRPGAETEYSLV
jgi:hypothetical protein